MTYDENWERAGTLRWFGRAFDTPMYEGMPEVPTPVGTHCLWCDEPILLADPGITMPYVGSPTPAAFHIECHLRQMIGSVAHLSGQCSCAGGPGIEHAQSLRDDARATAAHFWGEDWRTR